MNLKENDQELIATQLETMIEAHFTIMRALNKLKGALEEK